MPIYRLPDELIFPLPEQSEGDGLLAIGGDLSLPRLLLAYKQGIFPWYSEGTPILWWSPDPRLVLIPKNLSVSRSLKKELRKRRFTVTIDQAFPDVILGCAEDKRKDRGGTWIVEEMIDAYCNLHHAGFAHSVESWNNGQLVGGLYGVSLGRVFFGESMFHREKNASKVAFVHLVRLLHTWNFELIDCQVKTEHLMRFGAHEMSRSEFLTLLKRALFFDTRRGPWSFEEGHQSNEDIS